MPNTLESKAIDAALNSRWDQAVELNLEIIKTNKEDVEALTRLGRAYRALEKDAKAVEIFKKVLKVDPLNNIAQKNLEQLKNGIRIKSPSFAEAQSSGSFIIEPSTTKKITAHFDTKHIDPKKVVPGQKFFLEIKSDRVEVKNEKGAVVGTVCEEICNDFLVARKIYHLKELEATFLNVAKGPWVELLAKSDQPIFKATKQDLNPEARFVMDEEGGAE